MSRRDGDGGFRNGPAPEHSILDIVLAVLFAIAFLYVIWLLEVDGVMGPDGPEPTTAPSPVSIEIEVPARPAIGAGMAGPDANAHRAYARGEAAGVAVYRGAWASAPDGLPWYEVPYDPELWKTFPRWKDLRVGRESSLEVVYRSTPTAMPASMAKAKGRSK